MPAVIVIGAQWGDEGKGRVVDLLASQANVAARFSGGDNAGHTVSVQDNVFKLHLIPSGILRKHITGVLGNGMVINPIRLLEEMDQLVAMGINITPERLMISTRAHLITPAHLALDAAKEKARGDQAIGTTLRGIGPTYLDKIGRKGIRAGEMQALEDFAERLEYSFNEANKTLTRLDAEPINVQQSVRQYLDAATRLQPFLGDTSAYLNQQLKANEMVLCEGAQGVLLDVDHGSYPFVTSSSPTIGGVFTGLGFGPKYAERIVGVAKSYSTRVGSGPMPTELHDETADRLRGTGENFWDEFGTTTGRPRRCGWLDAVMLRYAMNVNGFTELMMTKMDILSGFETLKIAVAYEIDGKQVDYPPSTNPEMERAKPIYETLPGWSDELGNVRHAEDLPDAALGYIRRVSELCGLPVTMVSVGPERDQYIEL